MKSDERKFSLDDLPGDDWEVRFTKQIVRTIAHYRDLRGLTTEQLAVKCSEAYGEPGKVKGNTLNGLFAGKRKSIGVAELLVFARALEVPPIFLFLPMATGEEVEISPDDKIYAYSAYTYVTALRRPLLEYKLEPETYRDLYPFSDESVILDAFARHETSLNELRMTTEEWLGALMVEEEAKGKMKYSDKWHAERRKMTRERLQMLSDARFKLRAKGATPPPLPAALSFVDQEPLPDVPLPLENFADDAGVLKSRSWLVKQLMK